MIFVPTREKNAVVDTRITLDQSDSGFEDGYDRIVLLNVLAKRAGKKLYKKDGRCKWDDEDPKIAEKGMCVAEDLVETIAPYARAHAEKLAQGPKQHRASRGE